MKIRRRRGVESGADLTPMIDVVFQLILFFLVSTTFAVLPGITVNLPNSETAQATELAGITLRHCHGTERVAIFGAVKTFMKDFTIFEFRIKILWSPFASFVFYSKVDHL